MVELDRWTRFVDWFEFEILRRLGLIRLETYTSVTRFYTDWLKDIAEKGVVDDAERKSILAWKKEYPAD